MFVQDYSYNMTRGNDPLCTSESKPYIHYYVLSMFIGGTLWLVLLGLSICRLAKKAVKKRDENIPYYQYSDPPPQYHRQSSSINRESIVTFSDSEKNVFADLQNDYETIPEEYLEPKERKQNPKLPKVKASIIHNAEYDLANDNHEITREADQLLRILANPELFRKEEDPCSKPKRKHSTQNSVNALMAGMFRITGSVAATTGDKPVDETEHDAETVVKKENITIKSYSDEKIEYNSLSSRQRRSSISFKLETLSENTAETKYQDNIKSVGFENICKLENISENNSSVKSHKKDENYSEEFSTRKGRKIGRIEKVQSTVFIN